MTMPSLSGSDPRPVTLRSLPLPTPSLFDDRLPWSTVTAKEAARLIGVDPTTFNAWTYRGLGPLPVGGRKRSRTTLFRLSSIFQWLCERHAVGKPEEDVWREFLVTAGFEAALDQAGPDEIRAMIRLCDPGAQLD